MSLVRDAVTNLPIQIGGKYYITFARRSAFTTDKLDSVIAVEHVAIRAVVELLRFLHAAGHDPPRLSVELSSRSGRPMFAT